VNDRAITITILLLLSATLALAEDFKTVSGKIYKDATINRVEPDGIVLRTKSGISKVYFVELPKDVQKRFHYRPTKAVAAENESEPMNIAAKQEESPQADQDGLGSRFPVPGLFLGFLKLLVGAVIVTILVFAFVQRRL
jgi:hypothetical protein